MDLSFPRFVSVAEVSLPGDLAVLMVGVAARQAASPTALAQAGVVRAAPAYDNADPRLFAPLDGAFNGTMAARMLRWRRE